MNHDILLTTEPRQLALEISDATQKSAQTNSQTLLYATQQWQSYFNQLCFDTVLPWLEQEAETVNPVGSRYSLSNIWTLVGGSAITVNEKRVVLIPSEAIDTSELRVPQEWVDIPNWVGDYYFAVQVNPDESLIRIWGYTTHAQLKEQGTYDYQDRCYVLSAEQIIDDISAFWVAQELCPQERTRGVISSLPTLSLEHAENLLERLSHSNILEPRLAIPFEHWGALLAHDGWRQRLYERRQGIPEQHSILQWLQSGISELAQKWGWKQLDWQPELVGARGNPSSQQVAKAFCRPLTIGNQSYELQVMPIGDLSEGVWRFQLQPVAVGDMIPEGVTLRLLTEDLQPFEDNEATATTPTEQLYIDIALISGEGMVWETDPQPEGYEREILRF